MNTDKHFVIRVYAIIINHNNEVLLSDEYFNDTLMTKFPGGGLEWGEGTIECLKREAMEEFGQEIEICDHFYTTDYFQKALFHENSQLISIYYLSQFIEPVHFKISTEPYEFTEKVNGAQSFRWKPIGELTANDLTFPIDRRVGEMLKCLP
jgi:ADP-ribose pyrophosphatase YjhB (NUDIX family)